MGRRSKGKSKSESLSFLGEKNKTFGEKSLYLMKFYNLSIDVRQRKCVVVGGGKVALRKVRKLCAADAAVTVVAPDFVCEFQQNTFNPEIRLLAQKYSKEILNGAVLVFAATSDFAVNQQVCEDAKALGIWSNSVNGSEYGSFIIPASCHKDMLTIGITTEGKAPALSKELRQYFQEKLRKVSDNLLAELVELRAKKVAIIDAKEKEQLEQEIVRKARTIIKQMEQ